MKVYNTVQQARLEPLVPGIAEHKQVDYHDLDRLTAALDGVDVVLSFILPFTDTDNIAQKTLVDACVKAGVRRFAPSEWAVYVGNLILFIYQHQKHTMCSSENVFGHAADPEYSSSGSSSPFYQSRTDIRKYLELVNSPNLRLEYTCFQPGLFLDYFTYPMQSAKHLKITQHYIDFETRQAILVDNGEQPVTFTLIDDLAQVVAAAIDYEGIWPADGGVSGWQTTSAELVRVGERLRGGKKFKIYHVSKADLDAGHLASPWCPILAHPAIAEEQLEPMSRKINLEALKGIIEGDWVMTEDWNRLLPAVHFTDPLQFLNKWWTSRP